MEKECIGSGNYKVLSRSLGTAEFRGSFDISFSEFSLSSPPQCFNFFRFGLFGQITVDRSVMIAQYWSYNLCTYNYAWTLASAY